MQFSSTLKMIKEDTVGKAIHASLLLTNKQERESYRSVNVSE